MAPAASAVRQLKGMANRDWGLLEASHWKEMAHADYWVVAVAVADNHARDCLNERYYCSRHSGRWPGVSVAIDSSYP